MPRSSYGMEYILVLTCEHTGYVTAICMKDRKATTIAEALLSRLVFIYGPPDVLIIDQDAALSAKIMLELYTALGITHKLVSPANHGSLKTERSIQTLQKMLIRHLTGTGRNWPIYVPPCVYAMNTFINYTGYSPFEMVYLQKPPDLSEIYVAAIPGISKEISAFMDQMREKFELIK